MMAKSRVDVTALTGEVAVLGVWGGVDTHGTTHVAAAVDQLGRLLGTGSFAATAAGYRVLHAGLGGSGRCWRWEWRAPAVTVRGWLGR